MQYDVDHPQAYLDTLVDDWRKTALLRIREAILEHPSQPSEAINYKMLGYQLNDAFVLHLNAQKHYVGIYLGNLEKIDGAKALLDGFDCGKGCVRIKKRQASSDIPMQLIDLALKHVMQGHDLNC